VENVESEALNFLHPFLLDIGCCTAKLSLFFLKRRLHIFVTLKSTFLHYNQQCFTIIDLVKFAVKIQKYPVKRVLRLM